MPLDVDRLAAAVLEGTQALLAKALAPIIAENDALRLRLVAVEAREFPELPDIQEMINGAVVPLHAAMLSLDDVPELPDIPAMIAAAMAASAPEKPEEADPDEIRLLILGAVNAAVASIPPPLPVDVDEAAIVARVLEAIPAPEPAAEVDPEEIRLMIAEAVDEAVAAIPAPLTVEVDETKIAEAVARAVEALPPPERGADADPEEIRRQVAAAVDAAVAAIPAPENGKDADEAAIVARVLEAMPTRDELRGAPGRMPLVAPWVDRVHYEGEMVTRHGALWQARIDTGREPGGDDWACLAARGDDGRSPVFCGTYEEGGDYGYLNVVALNGGSFVAIRETPGECPGDGWQLLAARGKPGQTIKGDPGQTIKGDPGPPGITARDLTVDKEGVVTLELEDGRKLTADLYPLLSELRPVSASINQVTPPATLPLTVELAKANGRISIDAEDTLIEGYIRSALAHAEKWCSRAFEPQEWEITIDRFPACEIAIPFGPLGEVTSVRYTDTDGLEATVSPIDYVADTASRDGWVVPVAAWPSTMATINAVRVRYVAGRGTPPDVVQAILLLTEFWYEQRADASADAIKPIPNGARAILDLHRRLFV